MLESLDDAAFASLDDAYGPAVDVPGRLRALALGSLDEALSALYEIEGGVFHQGSYYPAAAATVPFLVEIASAELPVRAHLLLLLADMSGAPDGPEAAFDPLVWASQPGPPDYPEATAAIDAIGKGRETYVAALASPSPQVRASAAYLLSRLGGAEAELRAALERESDEAAELSMRLALLGTGEALPPARAGLCDDLTRGLGRGPLDERAEALARLLRTPLFPRPSMPFFLGDLVPPAITSLLEHRDDPRAWGLLRGALADRLARGERVLPVPGPRAELLDDEGAPGEGGEYGADRQLRELAAGLARVAFGDQPPAGRLLLRDELDGRQREVLSLTRDHGIPVGVPGAPWFEPRAMARFLSGGGPLDRVLSVEGEAKPVFVHLHALVSAPHAPGAAERASLVFEAAARELDDQALFDLIVDLLSGSYGLSPQGSPPEVVTGAIARHLEPRLLGDRGRFVAFARALLSRGAFGEGEARFALAPFVASGEACEPVLDPLASLALRPLQGAAHAFLRAFPEPRRSSLLARLGKAHLIRLLGAECDRRCLEEALASAFVSPSCRWTAFEAESLLETLTDQRLSELRAATVGTKARLVQRAMRARTGEGHLTLALAAVEGAVEARLTDWRGHTRLEARLSPSPTLEQLAPFVRACDDIDDPLVTLCGELDPVVEYRVMRLLPEVGLRGTVQSGPTPGRPG